MVEPILVNFGDVEEFTALPAGNYSVVVESVEVKLGKDSGDPYLAWDLKITQGPSAGRHLFFNSSLTTQSLWRLKAIFTALGVFKDGDEDETIAITPDPSSGMVISPQLVGLPATAVVRQEMYQSKMTNRVDDLLPMVGKLTPTRKKKSKVPLQVEEADEEEYEEENEEYEEEEEEKAPPPKKRKKKKPAKKKMNLK